MADISTAKPPKNASAALVLADGSVFFGKGLGAETTTEAEICFNTGMSGYQEILTDPSYAGQIITFTFPHIGNVGTNAEDIESATPFARGCVLREDITEPANWRSAQSFNDWLKGHNLPAICGVDTRALTRRVRDHGAPNAVLSVNYSGDFDLKALHKQAKAWPGLEGMDLAKDVSCTQQYGWDESLWYLGQGYGRAEDGHYHIVAIDYGAKRNILRCLAGAGFKVTVVPAQTNAANIIALKPDGVFLSNGPGDPAATADYAVPTIRELMEADIPVFGICLGHQLLAMALGGKTEKMHLGHRGGNQPVKDLATGKVEITSQNHGFCVIDESLPETVEITHLSLFDKSNEGIRAKDKPAFSVQYHPEASPGPMDSHYLFNRFYDMITDHKTKKAA